MELLTIVFGVLVVLFAYVLWLWWRDGRTWKPFCSRLCCRIRSALGVVSRDEMRVMEEHFRLREQQWETRVSQLEATAKFSNQLQYASKEIERRLSQLELLKDPNDSSKSMPVQRPRTLIRFGVLLTLSDAIWAHLGTQSADTMDDHFIDHMIKGPFCPVCLKRCIGRDRARHSADMPSQCRHCGTVWDGQETRHSLSSIELKRHVYEQLDQEYRTGGSTLTK